MTLPAWPFGNGKVSFAVSAGVPQSSFTPDFGPDINRPRATALTERANFSVIFYEGNFPTFRTWWSVTARGGDFTWTRPDTDESVIVRPVGGGYSAETVIGRNEADGQNEIVRVSFSADLITAPE